MFFIKIIHLPVIAFLLLLQLSAAEIEAASLPHLKNQQQNAQQQQQQQQQHQTQSQQSPHPQMATTQHATQQPQPHAQHQQQASQQQQQQQQQQNHQQLQQQHQMQQAQYVHEKETLPDPLRQINSEEDFSDPYHFTNDYKHDPRLPWNPYQQHMPSMPQLERLSSPVFGISPHQQQHLASLPPPPPPPGFGGLDGLPMYPTPKFMPLIGFPQPIFIPYPLYIAPEMFYPTFPPPINTDMEDTMSRARRPSSIGGTGGYHRNSPIYYVRLPPTPYMFLPSLGYSHAPSAFGTGFSPVLPFQSLPTFPSFSSIYNLPLNFLANGKPTSIYQMGGSPTDIQSNLHYGSFNGFNTRPPPPNPYRPTSASSSYYPQHSFGGIPSSVSSPASPHQDSKMTTLKRPFVFNGRPDDIYILPNDYNPIYSNNGYY